MHLPDLRSALAFTMLAAPFLFFALPPIPRQTLLTWYEAVVGVVASVAVGWQLARPPGSPSAARRALTAALVLLSSSSVIYNLRLLTVRDVSPLLAACGDVSCCAALLLILLYLLARLPRRSRASTLVPSLLLLVPSGWGVWHFAVATFLVATPASSATAAYCHILSWACAASIVALALPLSARCLGRSDALTMHSSLLLVGSALATTHALTQSGFAAPSWAEAGWAAGVGGLWAAALVAGPDASARPFVLAPYCSLRVGVAALACAGDVLVVLILRGSGLLRVDDGSELSTVVLCLLVSWTTVNFLALSVSRKVTAVCRLMPPASAIHRRRSRHKRPKLAPVPVSTGLAEADVIVSHYNCRVDEVNVLAQLLGRQRRRAALARMAIQVAHDIRGPLAALSRLSATFVSVPPSARKVFAGAVERIEAIAADLLAHQTPRVRVPGPRDADAAFCLGPLIAQVLGEARTYCMVKDGLHVRATTPRSALDAKVMGNPVELARALSNLLTNAVDSLTEGGHVSLTMTACRGAVHLDITDNGCGMPQEVLERLGEAHLTHSKSAGHGMGVPHAMRTVAGMRGTLIYESVPRHGTKVRIRLPTVAQPCPPARDAAATSASGGHA